MNLLYAGKYRQRFDPVIAHIKTLPRGSRILELCFGDIYIAEFCRKNNYEWTGLDINSDFVSTAARLGFDARTADLFKEEKLPQADACIMMGSFYHFYPHAGMVLQRMLSAARLVIISEPVVNLSTRGGLIGMVARKSANAGKGHETFRYDKRSLLSLLASNEDRLRFNLVAVEDHGRDLIVKLTRNGKH